MNEVKPRSVHFAQLIPCVHLGHTLKDRMRRNMHKKCENAMIILLLKCHMNQLFYSNILNLTSSTSWNSGKDWPLWAFLGSLEGWRHFVLCGFTVYGYGHNTSYYFGALVGVYSKDWALLILAYQKPPLAPLHKKSLSHKWIKEYETKSLC